MGNKVTQYADFVEELKTLVLKKLPLGNTKNVMTLRNFKNKYKEYFYNEIGEYTLPFQNQD